VDSIAGDYDDGIWKGMGIGIGNGMGIGIGWQR